MQLTTIRAFRTDIFSCAAPPPPPVVYSPCARTRVAFFTRELGTTAGCDREVFKYDQHATTTLAMFWTKKGPDQAKVAGYGIMNAHSEGTNCFGTTFSSRREWNDWPSVVPSVG